MCILRSSSWDGEIAKKKHLKSINYPLELGVHTFDERHMLKDWRDKLLNRVKAVAGKLPRQALPVPAKLKSILGGRRDMALVGIDISSTSVKLLQLARRGNGYEVKYYAVVPLPKGAAAEKEIKQPEKVVKAIERLIARSGTSAKAAAIAVSSSAVITKVIQMQAGLSERELEADIELEAEKYIPHPLDEVSLDYEVLGPTAQNPELNNVLLVASYSANVESRVAVVEEAGLAVKVVDVESYTMERAFHLLAPYLPKEMTEGVVAIVDIGSSMTMLNVIENGRLIYLHEELFGGNQLTQVIQQRYGLSQEQAELAKVSGELPDDYEKQVLEPFCKMVAQQTQRFLQFFYSSSPYSKIDGLLVAGGVAETDGLLATLQQDLGVDVRIANPLAHMEIASNLNAELLQHDAPSLLVATGLALRGFM